MGRLGPEASGKGVAALDEETHQLLKRFARGECTGVERVAACKLMQEQPKLVRIVAADLKKPKEAPSGRKQSGSR